jgi:hypothetical protein
LVCETLVGFLEIWEVSIGEAPSVCTEDAGLLRNPASVLSIVEREASIFFGAKVLSCCCMTACGYITEWTSGVVIKIESRDPRNLLITPYFDHAEWQQEFSSDFRGI